MTLSVYEQGLESSVGQNPIGTTHFGVNFIAGYNQTLPEGNFEQVIQSLGAGHIRYPGGTVTEQYFDPHGSVWEDLFENDEDFAIAEDGRTIEGPGRVFEFAARNDLEVTFVLPTGSIVRTVNGEIIVDESAVEKVQELVADILQGRFGEVTIDSFEIGNEYYVFPEMSAEEYSAVANELILVIDDAIQEFASNFDLPADWIAPGISVQSGAGWLDGDNDAIIEGLSDDALEAVTGVAAHYYSSDLNAVGARNAHLSQISDWENATAIDDLDYHISEWNISGTDTGMAQASSMIEAFDVMLGQGVDTSSIWGAQLRYLDCGLSVNTGSEDLELADSRLSVSGEMISSMSESLIGLQSIVYHGDDLVEVRNSNDHLVSHESGAYLVHVFGSEERAVIYISSRADENINLDLDIDGYFGDTSHVWGETLTSRDDNSTGWRDESDPLSAYGIADFDTLSSYDVFGLKPITLEPFEVLRLNVQLTSEGITMEDHDPLVSSDINYDDHLVGSHYDDTIIAHIGNDSLTGGRGDDIFRGGDGNDEILGCDGDDIAFGDSGSDQLTGGQGNDWLVGGAGNDAVLGGHGEDILSGNEGNDIVDGGAGNDLIAGGGGNDTLIGGSGGDYFVISSGNASTIVGFNASEGDQVTFLGQFDDAEHLAQSITTTEASDGAQGDLIVTSSDGTHTTFIGAAGQQDQLFGSVVDFTEVGQDTLAVADALNTLEVEEISAFVDTLDSDGFEETFGDLDGVILFSNLDPATSASLLNSFSEDERSDFLREIGTAGLKLALGEMTDEEAFSFFDSISETTIPNLVGLMGTQSIRAIFSGMDNLEQIALAEKYFPSEDAGGTSSLATSSGSLNAQDSANTGLRTFELDYDDEPIDENDESDESDENDEQYSVLADCFVATVVYSGGEHPDIWLLRWYRDQIMRKSLVGRFAILLYWHLGPVLAEWTSGKPFFTKIIRRMIGIIVRTISRAYGRNPGLQPDQPFLYDSRKIRLRKS